MSDFRLPSKSIIFFFECQLLLRCLLLSLRNSPRTFRFSRLRGRFFFDQYQSVAELLGLPFEFRFESFLALGVALCPKRVVVLDLLLHHCVEDDRDLCARSLWWPPRVPVCSSPAEGSRLMGFCRDGGDMPPCGISFFQPGCAPCGYPATALALH